MGKNNRREVAKRLTQEIGVTTDPQTLIELSKQLAKVLPKRRRTSGPLEKTKKNLLLDGNQVLTRMVGQVEAKMRALGKKDEITRHAVVADVTKSFSAEECAAVESLNTEKVV